MGEIPGEIPEYLKETMDEPVSGTIEEKIDQDTETFRDALRSRPSGRLATRDLRDYKITLEHQRNKEQGMETGIESESIPDTVTLKKFWKGVRRGVYEPMTEEEAREIAEAQLEKYTPMTALTADEKDRILYDFMDNIRDRTTRQEIQTLECKLINTLYADKAEGKRIFEELKNPESKLIKSLESQGIRYFFNSEKNKLGDSDRYDSYGYTEESFDKLMTIIRANTGKQVIRMLDIGGASGKALHEAQEHDSDLETFDITVDEEPAMYPVDHIVVCPVENMPKELEESMDFVVSRTTWRYFTYPDIAIRNAVKALSIEGKADIYIIFTRSSLKKTEEGKAELNQRIKSVFCDLKKLEQDGYIETNLGEAPEDAFDMDTDGFLKITKKKSIKEVQF